MVILESRKDRLKILDDRRTIRFGRKIGFGIHQHTLSLKPRSLLQLLQI